MRWITPRKLFHILQSSGQEQPKWKDSTASEGTAKPASHARARHGKVLRTVGHIQELTVTKTCLWSRVLHSILPFLDAHWYGLPSSLRVYVHECSATLRAHRHQQLNVLKSTTCPRGLLACLRELRVHRHHTTCLAAQSVTATVSAFNGR